MLIETGPKGETYAPSKGPQAGWDIEAEAKTERRPVYMHGGSHSRYGVRIEHSLIAPNGAWKVTHHTKRVNAAKCSKQQRNSM
ncbi:hypothetical protein V6N12_017184 [Hibiscus sabdariffa]|uniref:Uncharacterized protein n=1 Tax=Hibiscus sabdariffa TaxID=183260 RepID=A0ABR1ZPT5_9ROSI